MSKSALSNSMLYGTGSLIKACASFFLLPLYTDILGASQYGVLNLLQTFSIILSTFISFALERSLYRLYYDYKTAEEKKHFLSTTFWSINGIGVCFIILFLLWGNTLTSYLGSVDFYSVLIPVVLYSYVNSLINFSQIALQTRQEGVRYLFISLMILFIYNILCIILLFCYSPTYSSMIYASFITVLIVFPISFSYIKKDIILYFNFKIFKNVFSFCFPILGTVLFTWVLNFSDRFFLANLTTLNDVGLYSFASKIVSIVPLFCGAIYQSYVPYFYSITNSNSYEKSILKLKPINDTIIFLICCICLLIVSIYKFVLHTFFSSDFFESADFFFLLILGALIGQQVGLFNNMLLQNKKSGTISIISISAGVLSVFFNISFIPTIGRIGASISNLLISSLIVLSVFFMAKKEYYIPYNFRLLCLGVVSIVIMYVFGEILSDTLLQIGFNMIVIGLFVFFVYKMKIMDWIILNRVYNSVLCRIKNIIK